MNTSICLGYTGNYYHFNNGNGPLQDKYKHVNQITFIKALDSVTSSSTGIGSKDVSYISSCCANILLLTGASCLHGHTK